MLRARAAIAAGVIVVLAAFAYGTEHLVTTTVAGQRVDCGSAISADWLVSGTGAAMVTPGQPTTADQRRRSAACAPVVQRARTGVFSTMVAGGLLALVGWTALRDPRAPRRVVRPEARAT